MANQEITFTITKINNTGDNGLEIEVNSLEFPTGKGNEKAEIKKIFFVGQESSQFKTAFQSGKTFQVTFNNCKIEDERGPKMMHGAVMISDKPKKMPDVLVLKENNGLEVVCNNNDTIQVEEKTGGAGNSWQSADNRNL
ncbi:6918_t:CDS:1, partial [Ambispora leptoticha]